MLLKTRMKNNFSVITHCNFFFTSKSDMGLVCCFYWMILFITCSIYKGCRLWKYNKVTNIICDKNTNRYKKYFFILMNKCLFAIPRSLLTLSDPHLKLQLNHTLLGPADPDIITRMSQNCSMKAVGVFWYHNNVQNVNKN